MGSMSFVARHKYKCKLYGSQLIVVDKISPKKVFNTLTHRYQIGIFGEVYRRNSCSQTCSNCEFVLQSLLSSERVFNFENSIQVLVMANFFDR